MIWDEYFMLRIKSSPSRNQQQISKDRLLRTQQDLSKYASSWITRVAYHLCNSSFKKQARMSQAQRLVAVPREGQEKHIWLHSVNRYVTSAFTSCRDCARRRKSLQAWDRRITQKYSGGWHAAGGGTDGQSAQHGKDALGPAQPLEVGGSSPGSSSRRSWQWEVEGSPETGRLGVLSWVGRWRIRQKRAQLASWSKWLLGYTRVIGKVPWTGRQQWCRPHAKTALSKILDHVQVRHASGASRYLPASPLFPNLRLLM